MKCLRKPAPACPASPCSSIWSPSQLNRGERPFLRPLSKFEDKSDIALREIAEGLVVAQVDMQAVEEHMEAQARWGRHV